MQASTATRVYKAKKVLARWVQLSAVISFVVTSVSLLEVYSLSVINLRSRPMNATELVKTCKNKEGDTTLSRAESVVCQDLENVCWKGRRNSTYDSYQQCYEAEAAIRIEDLAIETAAKSSWREMRIIMLCTCFFSTLVQCYCGIFAAALDNNKFLTYLFSISNAVILGYCIAGASDGGSVLYYIPVPFIIFSAWMGAQLLQKQAQAVVLPSMEISALEGGGTGRNTERSSAAGAIDWAGPNFEDV